MTELKKICIVTNSFPRFESDYAGNFIPRIIEILDGKYEFHVVYPSNMDLSLSNSEPFIRYPVKYPFNTYPMSQVKGIDQLHSLSILYYMFVKIKELIRDNHIDLIHAYWAIPSGFAASVSNSNIPYILTLPGSDIKIFSKNSILRYPIRYSLRRASKLIAVSNDLKQEVIKLGADEKKIAVIPVGVDITKFKPMNKTMLRVKLGLPNRFTAIFVGTLFSIKNVDMLIRVFRRVSNLPDVNLLIIGDGPERNNLESLVKSYNLNNIIFKGKIPHSEMPGYIASSDVLLLSSKSEGLPACVQEAMACGIPVIATNVGGLPDIVQNGITGFLVHDEDEMEKSLRYLISNQRVLDEFGKAALNYAIHNLSIDTASNSIAEIYESLLLIK